MSRRRSLYQCRHVRRAGFIALLAGLVFAWPPSAIAQQAVVRSYDAPELEVGQAWLVRSGERCFAVLPLHVARETAVPSLLREGVRGLRGEALEVFDLGDDAAVALMSGSVADDCGLTLGSISRNVSGHIRGGGLGTLRTVNGDGTLGRLSVTVIDDDGQQILRVLPTVPGERIRKGHSGSLLMVNDQPVGMLLSVNARSGVGAVMRADVLLSKVERHLRSSGASRASVATANDSRAAVAGPVSEGVWQMVSWNVDPIGSDHTAAMLMAEGEQGFWAARVPQWPVAIELGGPEDSRLVRGVAFVAGAVVDPAHLPSRVQVLTSLSREPPNWRVAGSGVLSYGEGVATLEFLPVRARFIRLEIFGSQEAADQLALGRVRVLEAGP